MSRLLGTELPERLLERLSAAHAVRYADRAMVIVSLDDHGWPHPAMVSTLELVARDAGRVRLAMPASSRTARHLVTNRLLTIVVADEQAVYYVKAEALLMPRELRSLPGAALFEARVDSVLEDLPHGDEHARLTSGLTLARTRFEASQAAAQVAELVNP